MRAANGRYQRVSHFLAYTVMREGEAVLARNVMGDSTMGMFLHVVRELQLVRRG